MKLGLFGLNLDLCARDPEVLVHAVVTAEDLIADIDQEAGEATARALALRGLPRRERHAARAAIDEAGMTQPGLAAHRGRTGRRLPGVGWRTSWVRRGRRCRRAATGRRPAGGSGRPRCRGSPRD